MENKLRVIQEEIDELYRLTPRHIDGVIYGSMTTWPHPVGVKTFMKFIHVNGNDPVTFKIVAEYERKLINEVGSLIGATTGMHTSGGTESNILAVWIAKRLSRGKVVLAPSTVHKSIDKACLLMDLKLVKIPVNPLSPVDPSIIENYVFEYKPFIVIITAGTTETGVIDPVKEVAELASKHGFYLHVDAAYGGLLIPFLRRHGLVQEDLYMFNGVSSITIDMHKVGMAPIPSSILFVKDNEFLESACFEMDYMPIGKSCGLLGTRPGAAVISSYYTWRATGVENYERNALKMLSLAKKHYPLLFLDLRYIDQINYWKY
ncbi:MAG: aminotransferase class V-fold PLP-dependent enzyme [Desulfurococcaceae archaeon]